MKNVYLPIALIIFGAVCYQFSQKSIPKTANPMLVLILAYSIGIGICIIFNFLFPNQQTITESVKELNWTVIGVGVGAIMIETGFLLAYRTGWDISSTALIVNIAVSLLLIPIGILVFKEQISSWKALGIIFCIIGLLLISKK